MREIDLRGERFAVAEAGSGPPLLFLHGAPGDLRTWRPHFFLLADRFRCIAYTQRWFGGRAWRSDGPPFGTATHAADLVAFVRALELAPVRLVAWSYSGHVAFEAALDAPELFHSLLVYEPGVPTYVEDAAELAAWGADAGAMFPPIAEAVAAGEWDDAVRRLIDASGGEGAFNAQAAERREVHLASAATMPLLFGGADPPTEIAASDLGRLPIPATIAWGERSRPVFTIPSRAAAHCTGLRLEVPGAGHLWPEQDPEGFCALVAGWASD